VVAQIDKQDPPVVAHTVHPALQANILSDVVLGQLGAGVAAKGVHGVILLGMCIWKVRADTP